MTIKNLDQLLLTVQRPGRYTGGEWNSLRKEWDVGKIKFLLTFPDLYDVGMSYLGMKILYGIINDREDSLCERIFSPWPDFEEVLRKNEIELFSLESRRPVKEFDIIGFSLAYELNYTNVLNILDLGHIPVRSIDRKDDDPIIIGGGPSCYNPEPMADFIDAFIIGEGEEVIGEVIETYKRSKGDKETKIQRDRAGLLKELAKIKGVYVPSLYKVEYNADNTIHSFLPIDKDVPARIEKRVVKDFENSFYPVNQIVPYIQIVHDRIAIEILRGCKHACKFCLSGTTYRPYRERSKEKILKLAEESYRSTGYEEISLLSLSSGDHSQIQDIIKGLNVIFKDKAVSVSFPSLRIQDLLTNLPSLISEVKKTGLTFAPESGSECLRRFINKNIDIEMLFKTVSESFRAGWNRVKLYFMIGLPEEKEGDVLSIVELVGSISDLKRPVDGRPAHVTASINAFVPKPHTPFEREAMDDIETLRRKKEMLRKSEKLHGRNSRVLEFDFNSFERSYMEAVFSRGDRRLGDVIYEAWRSGAKFDSWQEHFKFDLWIDSFKKRNIDPDHYSKRARGRDEILPWDFIRISS